MAIYYIDFDNGSDANNGTTWALAWKTITNGATAARIAAGDTIRCSKTPDPVSIGNATWTNLSKTVTLATAQTLTIDLCNTTAYTASTNITATVSTTRKEGSHSCSLAVATAFTTGKMAYKTLTTLDASSYQKLSFWFRNTVAIASDTVLKVCLCSDTTGDTIVDTFWIPAIPSTNRFVPLTITKDGGGNLGSSIQSIAIYANSDPGTPTLLFDDFIACTTSGLCLQTLISKNGSAQGGTEGYYGIQSINGTTILLDNDTETAQTAGRGYSGTTETVTTYMRSTYKTAMASSATTAVSTLNDSGSLGNLISYEFGYEVGTTNQNGETYLDGLNGNGYGLELSLKSFISLNLCSLVRYNYGIDFTNNCVNLDVNTVSMSNCVTGIFFSTLRNSSFNSIQIYNCGSYGINLSNSSNNTFSLVKIFNTNTYGANITGQSNNIINELYLNNNLYGINYDNSTNNLIKKLTTLNNSTSAILCNSLNFIRNASISESTEFTGTSFSQGILWSYDHDQTDGNHWGFFYGGTFNWQTTTYHGTETGSWKTAITSSDRKSNYKAILPLDKDGFAGAASTNLVVTAWVKKDHATNIACRLVCYADDALGISEVSATKANDTNWEQLSITLNSTHANPVFKVVLESWYVSGNSNSYLGSITVT